MPANLQSLVTVVSNCLSLGQFELAASCIGQLFAADNGFTTAALRTLVVHGAGT